VLQTPDRVDEFDPNYMLGIIITLPFPEYLSIRVKVVDRSRYSWENTFI
jgi:hypothetical protein